MNEEDTEALRTAIAALEAQRATLGDAVVELAVAPLRARLAALQRPAGLKHRQVTVLFADVVGSAAIAGGLQDEEASGLVASTLRRMAEIVQAQHGRVLRFMGDGLKAAFGMDETHEDDAERAVRAGLAILGAGLEQAVLAQRVHGVDDFAVRVGVHTGSVALGAGVEADNTAMGAAVNIAARMEQSAPPGTLRISHDTWSQVRGLFEMEAQPPLALKGVAAPMTTYLVRSALDRNVASVERGLQGLATPMVGRDAELQRLLHAVEQARQTRQLQALTLLGDAGLGKSRLLRELKAALGSGAGEHRVITLRSQPDGLLRLWGLLRSLLATQFGVADTDSAEVACRKVVDGLSPCFAERGEQQAQLIGQLSGLDYGDSPHLRGLDPRSLRDQAFDALRAYLQSLAADGALPVLVIEDLHWADDGSLDLLQHLVSHAAELPLALIMSGRPALLQRRPGWGTPETTVQLGPLAAAQSDQLAQALLQRLEVVPPKLSELIVGRAEGNPYYMEELVRRLVDDGVIAVDGPRWTLHEDRLDSVRLPGTLVGLLQARLDALPAGERQAARQASIVGHVFWDDALQALDAQAPQALPALQQAAFVKAHDTSAFDGTPERQFDHHLLHQVTYDTLLKAERKLGHGAAARWLQERTQGRGAEFLALTGEHAERAGETALAVDCFDRAGDEAEGRFANAAAVAWTRRALALLADAEPLRRFDLMNRLSRIADTAGDRAGQDALHAEMEALLEQHPDGRRQADLLFDQALLASRLGENGESERLSRRAFEVAERHGVAQWAAMAQANLAWLHIERSDYAGARRHIDVALPWAGRIPAASYRAVTEAQVLTVSAMISTETGQLAEAREALLAVLSRGEAIDSPRVQLGALDNLALIANYTGRWDEAAAWGERERALAQSIGSPVNVADGQLRMAEAAEGLGDTASAILWHKQGLAIRRTMGDRRPQAVALRFLTGLHLQRGEAQLALECCAQAQTLHEALEEALEACHVAAYTALCEARLGRPAAALAALNPTLGRLTGDLSPYPAFKTIDLRWTCLQVLDALGDARAEPLLEQLHADVQTRATQITDAADRERLIQACPIYREVVAAYARRGRQDAAP